MRKVHILAVCGAGAGSSAILMVNIRKALNLLGVEGNVDMAPLYLISAFSPDIICCAKTFASRIEEQLGSKKIPIVTITNFGSVEEIASKLKKVLTDMGYLK